MRGKRIILYRLPASFPSPYIIALVLLTFASVNAVIGSDAHGRVINSNANVIQYKDLESNSLVLCKVEEDTWNDGAIDASFCFSYNENRKKIKMEAYYGSDAKIDQIEYYYYDAKGNEIKRVQVGAGGSIDWVYFNYYDINDNLIRVEQDTKYDGSINSREQLEYDTYGNLIRREFWWDTYGSDEYRYYYDSNGNQVKAESDLQKDGIIDVISYFYFDSSGKLVREEKDYGYNGLDNGVIDSITNYYYDLQGNKIRAETDDGEGGTINWRNWYYDAYGNVIKEEDGDHETIYSTWQEPPCPACLEGDLYSKAMPWILLLLME